MKIYSSSIIIIFNAWANHMIDDSSPTHFKQNEVFTGIFTINLPLHTPCVHICHKYMFKDAKNDLS